MRQALASVVRPRLLGFSLVAITLASVALADVVLETYVTSLTTYKGTGKTTVQNVRPRPEQRGVGLDGSLRAAPTFPMALTGNPFEAAWRGHDAIGDVHLDTGTYNPTEIDISLPAPGFRWVVGRTYNSRQDDSGHFNSNGVFGFNWMGTSQPELVFYDDAGSAAYDLIYLVYGADRYIEFQRKDVSSNDFKAKNGAAGAFTYAGGSPDIWTYTDSVGNTFKFFGGNTGSNRANWQLWKITDPDGNVAYVGDASTAATAVTAGYDTSSRMTTAYDSASRRYSYNYSSGTIGGIKRVESVVVERLLSGTWSSPGTLEEVQRVEYAYYTSDGDSHGDAGDLKTVTITTPLSGGAHDDVRTRYFRYWDGSYNASGSPRTNPGYPHFLKMVVDFEGVRNFDWSEVGIGEPTFDAGYLSASDADLKEYSSVYLEYNASKQVDQFFMNGQCGCGSSASGLHLVTYHTSGGSFTGNYDAIWARRAVVERPDGSFLTQYFDECGQALSQVITSATPATGTPDTWVTAVTRDSTGCITQIAMPDSVTGYTHNTTGNPDGAISVDNDGGLVWTYVRAPSGDFTGFWTDRQYSEGTAGDKFYDRTFAYTSFSKTLTDVSIKRPLIDTDTVYSEAITTGSSGIRTTDYDYTAWSGADLSIENVTTTPPIVDEDNNGSETSQPSYAHRRKDGLVDYEKSALGRITYRGYTNGQLTTLREDADTGSLPEPTGYTSSGTELDRTTTFTFDLQGRLDETALPGGRVEKRYYTALADRRLVTTVYPNYTGSDYFGPAQLSITNQAGRVVDLGVVPIEAADTDTAIEDHIDEGQSETIAAVDVAGLTHIAGNEYDPSGTRLLTRRSYFATPGALPGIEGTNYDATGLAYDSMGHRVREKGPSGTIRRTDFDKLGRVSAKWVGTNDYGTLGGESSGPNNMVKTEALVYDGGNDGGNSYLTNRTLYVVDSSSGQRVTTYTNDLRGRVLLAENPDGPDILTTYDNIGRATASGAYTTVSASAVATSEDSGRLSLSETVYDERGRIFKTIRHEIDFDGSDGADTSSLTALTWYDADGRVIKERGEEFTKTFYDRLGRVTHRFVIGTADESDTATYADADDVDGDTVLEERQTTYDAAGDVIMEATISRFHDDIGGGATAGALDTNADNDRLAYDDADVLGRIQITAMWYDANTDRLTDRAEYGTNGGAAFDRDGLGVPSRPTADTVLLTSYTYNDDGTLKDVTDPRDIVTHSEYDALGRRTRVINNFDDGTPGGGTNDEKDQVMVYAYTDGLQTSITADLPYPQTDQVTTYTYGVTKGTSPGDSKISSNELLKKVQYPDSSDATDDVVKFAYNAQGQVTWKKDQYIASPAAGGNIIETTYDTGGREIVRAVTTLGTGFDGAVRRIETAYTPLGQVEKVTQYDAASSGSVVDEVKYTYDGWSNVTHFQQDRDSAVSGGGNEYDVSYTYETATGGRHTVRRTDETLGGKTFTFQYRASSGVQDGTASRVTAIKDGGTPLTSYDYVGVGQVVGTYYDEPDVMSRQYSGSPDDYADLDPFNRVITSKWTKDLGTDVDFYKVTLTYDRDSNITSADEAGDASSNGHGHVGFDVKYTMDGLNRLVRAEEGTLSGTISSRTRDQQWVLNQVGDWTEDKLDLTGDLAYGGTNEWDDTKTHNAVNEIVTRDLDSTPGTTGNNYTLAYDPAGNLTNDATDYKYEWDAFYRLRKVKTQGNALVAEYRYNGLGYRIGVHQDTDTDADVDGSDLWYYFAYDERWRMVATYRGSDSSPKERFVHQQAGAGGFGGSSYIDLVAFREKDANTAWTSASDGVLEERLYYCQNQHADVVALATAAGGQREMARYSAYGVPYGAPVGDCNSDGDCDSSDRSQVQSWINAPNYDTRADVDLDGDVDSTDKNTIRDNYEGVTLGRGALSAVTVGNRRGYAGYEVDTHIETPTYQVRHRTLNSSVGAWTARDFIEYAAGPTLVGYVRANPTSYVDPSGTYDTCVGVLCKQVTDAAATSNYSITYKQTLGAMPKVLGPNDTEVSHAVTNGCKEPCKSQAIAAALKEYVVNHGEDETLCTLPCGCHATSQSKTTHVTMDKDVVFTCLCRKNAQVYIIEYKVHVRYEGECKYKLWSGTCYTGYLPQ